MVGQRKRPPREILHADSRRPQIPGARSGPVGAPVGGDFAHRTRSVKGGKRMRVSNIVRMRLRALFRRNRVEQDLDEELRDYVERDTEENIRAGVPPELARLRAIRSLEGIE